MCQLKNLIIGSLFTYELVSIRIGKDTLRERILAGINLAAGQIIPIRENKIK